LNIKILVFGIVLILNFSTFFVLANNNRESGFDVGSISGYVRQVNGNPIVDATVEVIRQDEGGWWETYTESDGSYLITGLPTGVYKIRAYKTGYAREYYDNVFYSNEATTIHVNPAEEITGIDFILTLGGSISGHIFQIDGVTPIVGAEVVAYPSKYRFDDGFWTMTDANGAYTIENLCLGLFRVTSIADGYVELIKYYNDVYGWFNAWDIIVTPPDDTPGIDIKLERAGSISGYVFASDGITPIPGVHVSSDTKTYDFVEGFGTDTNDDGSYLIENILPGTGTVRTIPPIDTWYAGEFYDSEYTCETADDVIVTEDNNTNNINFTLDEGGSIKGYVYDEDTGDPLSGISLFPWMPNGDVTASIATTSYDGSYKFVLKPGEYIIGTGEDSDCVLGNMYIPEWYNNAFDMNNATLVSVNLHEETTGIDLYLSKSGSISGVVLNEDGNPISDASIYAYSDLFSGGGSNTQSNGTYEIEGLPSGDYIVQVTVSGFNTQYYNNVSDPADATLVNVNAPDETKNINFFLTEGIGVYISRPEIGALYLFNNEILSLPFDFPVILGEINVKAVAFGADKVEFYVDDDLKHTDDESPFSWLWDKFAFGRRTVKVVVYEVVDIISDEIVVWKFF
jgi:hypothetical protein